MDEHYCKHEKDWGSLSEWQTNASVKLDEILSNVRNTNGRVKQLERWRLVIVVAVFTILIMQGVDIRSFLLNLLGPVPL